MNELIKYFDLGSEVRSKLPTQRATTSDKKDIHWLIQYIALLLGIIIQPFIFVLTPRPKIYLNTAICLPGDSGAWVISEYGGILNWDGMLFAGDGSHAYCCFAEYILQACNDSGVFPHGLALVT